MSRVSTTKLRKWHESQINHFDSLGRVVASSVESLLTEKSVPFLSVTYRVKTVESFLKKAKKKKYSDATTQCTDVLGIRIITYIESDVERVSEILKGTFMIDENNSLDKSALLEVDRIGYRSVHCVATLGEARCALPEFSRFHSTVFEIQIRTVLQHAWAEIEHDRNYKLPTSLPQNLERRLFLIAGVLELADREFNALASDIDDYTKTVTSRTTEGDLNIDINTPSLRIYCDRIREKLKHAKIERSLEVSTSGEMIEELKDFGFERLQDIEKEITPAFLRAYDREWTTTEMGFLRDVMMFADIDRYFEKAWKTKWGYMDPDDLAVFTKKYGARAESLMRSNGIHLEKIDFDDFPDDSQS